MTSDGPAKENAALICRAVNAHDELVEALRAVTDEAENLLEFASRQCEFESDGEDALAVIKRARAALSKALGNDGGAA